MAVSAAANSLSSLFVSLSARAPEIGNSRGLSATPATPAAAADNLAAYKIVCMAGLFLLALAGFGLSLKMRGSERLFDWGNAVAAGVMLSGAVVHLIPDAAKHMEAFQEQHLDGYPLSSLLVCVAFLSLMFLEKAIEIYLERCGDERCQEDRSVVEIPSPGHVSNTAHGRPSDTTTSSALGSGSSAAQIVGSKSPVQNPSTHDHGLSEVVGMQEYQALVLVLAINFHAVMEGLGLGAETDQDGLIKFMIALAAHKGLEAMAVGSAVVCSKAPLTRFWTYGLVFSLATPAGIGIGWLVGQASGDTAEGSVGANVCTSLAAGTFLWAAVMEFIPHVFASHKRFLSKSLYLLAGFSAMSIVAIWA